MTKADRYGPWITSGSALERVAVQIGRLQAIDCIVDCLRASKILAWGYYRRREFQLYEVGRRDQNPIPLDFWRGATPADVAQWSWSGGFFSIPTGGFAVPELHAGYDDVHFDEAGIHSLLESFSVPERNGTIIGGILPTGYSVADAPLVERMRSLMKAGEAKSVRAAAIMVAPDARGHSEEAKVDRLSRRYRKLFERVGEAVPNHPQSSRMRPQS